MYILWSHIVVPMNQKLLKDLSNERNLIIAIIYIYIYIYIPGNVGRLYLAKKEEGRGRELISCKECVNVEMQSLGKYLSERKEWILKFVVVEKEFPEVEDPDTFKKRLKGEKTSQWLENPFSG